MIHCRQVRSPNFAERHPEKPEWTLHLVSCWPFPRHSHLSTREGWPRKTYKSLLQQRHHACHGFPLAFLLPHSCSEEVMPKLTAMGAAILIVLDLGTPERSRERQWQLFLLHTSQAPASFWRHSTTGCKVTLPLCIGLCLLTVAWNPYRHLSRLCLACRGPQHGRELAVWGGVNAMHLILGALWWEAMVSDRLCSPDCTQFSFVKTSSSFHHAQV